MIKSSETNAVLDDIDEVISEAGELALEISQRRCAEAVDRVLQTASLSRGWFPWKVDERSLDEWVLNDIWTNDRSATFVESLDWFKYPEDADPDSPYDSDKVGLVWITTEVIGPSNRPGYEVVEERQHWFWKPRNDSAHEAPSTYDADQEYETWLAGWYR